MAGALLIHTAEKGFKAIVLLINVFQGGDKKETIFAVEGAVYKSKKWFEILRTGVYQEIVRGIVHEVNKPVGIGNDRFPVAPGDGGCQESGNLDILFDCETVGDRYRVAFNKMRLIILAVFLFKEGKQFQRSQPHVASPVPVPVN